MTFVVTLPPKSADVVSGTARLDTTGRTGTVWVMLPGPGAFAVELGGGGATVDVEGLSGGDDAVRGGDGRKGADVSRAVAVTDGVETVDGEPGPTAATSRAREDDVQPAITTAAPASSPTMIQYPPNFATAGPPT
ncbi:MAG: hypothetical protein QOD31_3202 [Pseudonocardiales bacterium]|nr:hypothetical protein [Pseudonocardiales bacterium]MDT4959403.1 hypothetical protein [Pseudonocardiales bacterium]